MLYDHETPLGRSYDFRSPDLNADHFGRIHPLPENPRPTAALPHEVQISVPTLGLHPYVLDSIENLITAIAQDFHQSDPGLLPTIAVVSNGPASQADLTAFLDRFLAAPQNRPKVTLIRTRVLSKSNAVNLLHQNALRSGAKIMICLDDDLLLGAGVLARLYGELAGGYPRFVGIASIPTAPQTQSKVKQDIYSMTIAKRNVMGWPAPIGRLNGMPTAIYPTITRYDLYDDVFLSAFFYVHGIDQYVIPGIHTFYRSSKSLYEYTRRCRRIESSDRRILEALPQSFAASYRNFAIRPLPLKSASSADLAWIEISRRLLRHAKDSGCFAVDSLSLDETDLSSKAERAQEQPSIYEADLCRKLAELKRRYDFD